MYFEQIVGGTIADPSTTKVNPIGRRSNTEDRGSGARLLTDNIIIVARKAKRKPIAGKGRMIMGEREGETRTTEDKPDEVTRPERQMDKSGTVKSRKKEWQNGTQKFYLSRERER